MLGPPCDRFSIAQNGQARRETPEDQRRKRAEVMVLLGFAMEVALEQRQNHRKFAVERPGTAISRCTGAARFISELPGVQGIDVDLRRFRVSGRGSGRALQEARASDVKLRRVSSTL